MNKQSKILITGSGGMVGSSVVRLLTKLGYTNLLTPRKADLDLRDTSNVKNYFETHQPEYVFLIAAKVG